MMVCWGGVVIYVFLWISGQRHFVLVYIRGQENAGEIDLAWWMDIAATRKAKALHQTIK